MRDFIWVLVDCRGGHRVGQESDDVVRHEGPQPPVLVGVRVLPNLVLHRGPGPTKAIHHYVGAYLVVLKVAHIELVMVLH